MRNRMAAAPTASRPGKKKNREATPGCCALPYVRPPEKRPPMFWRPHFRDPLTDPEITRRLPPSPTSVAQIAADAGLPEQDYRCRSRAPAALVGLLYWARRRGPVPLLSRTRTTGSDSRSRARICTRPSSPSWPSTSSPYWQGAPASSSPSCSTSPAHRRGCRASRVESEFLLNQSDKTPLLTESRGWGGMSGVGAGCCSGPVR